MMPHHCSSTKTDCVAAVEQAPADIHIIAGDAESFVKPSDPFKNAFAESHVAARNVLGNLVGQQDVPRPAGGMSHALCHRAQRRASARLTAEAEDAEKSKEHRPQME